MGLWAPTDHQSFICNPLNRVDGSLFCKCLLRRRIYGAMHRIMNSHDREYRSVASLVYYIYIWLTLLKIMCNNTFHTNKEKHEKKDTTLCN